jgi:hypothetical protein
MKPSFSLALSYLKNLGKKWILWLFVALDFIAIIVQIFIPSLMLPQSLFIGVAILGLLWAGFEVYLDLLLKIPGEARPLKPEIEILLEEGNEYSYEFEQYQLFEQYPDELEKLKNATLRNSVFNLRLRVENTGYVAVNILTIGGDIDMHHPFSFMVPNARNRDDTKISFPVLLDAKEKLPITLIDSIHPYSNFTDAQIAARTRKLRETKATVKVSIFVEVIDPAGEVHRYSSTHQVSILPLCDMYISHWKRINKNNLVSLALGVTSPESTGNHGDEDVSQSQDAKK